jgi:ankyrin repeat protein
MKMVLILFLGFVSSFSSAYGIIRDWGGSSGPRVYIEPESPRLIRIKKLVKSHEALDNQTLADLNIRSPLFHEEIYRDPKLVQELIDKKIDVNAVDIKGKFPSPLYLALKVGNLDSILILLHAGANPNAGFLLRQTHLKMAIKKGFVDVVKALLLYGANPLETDARGYTSIMWALGIKSKRSDSIVPIIQELLSYGADPERINSAGLDSLKYAKSRYLSGSRQPKFKKSLKEAGNLLFNFMQAKHELQKEALLSVSKTDDSQKTPVQLPEELVDQILRYTSGN